MRHIILAILAILAVLGAAAQGGGQTFTLIGLVRDKLTNAQLMNADVRLYDERDSLVAEEKAFLNEWDERTQTYKERAEFYLEMPRRKGDYTLRISAEGHDTLSVGVGLRNIGRREQHRDLGTLYLTQTRRVQLDEVTVTATKVKFYHRGDTLVFNADAFQLAEGSMLDALIKQLPGVELKDGGEIFVNGKKVESLLLNGKDFFRGDNRLMLDNLGAYTVKNIEVYKKQTERAQFLGLDGEEDKRLTMDVKLKKEFSGGWIANLEAGAGTEERYMGRLFAMRFNELSQFTLIGNANNLNDSRRLSDNSSWRPEYRPNGTKQFRQLGANYSVEDAEGMRKASGSLTVKAERNLSETERTATNFLQTMTTQGHSLAHALNRSFEVATDHDLQYSFNKNIHLLLQPKFSFRRGKGENGSDSETWLSGMESPSTGSLPAVPGGSEEVENLDILYGLDNSRLINRSLSQAFNTDRNLNASLDFLADFRIPKTSDAFTFDFGLKHSSQQGESEAQSVVTYGDQTLSPIARNSLTVNRPNHFNLADFDVQYYWVKSSNLYLTLMYGYKTQRETKTSSFYLGELISDHTGDYTMENLVSIDRSFDPTNSNASTETKSLHYFHPQLHWKPKENMSLQAYFDIFHPSNSLIYNQNGIERRAEFKEWALGKAYVFWRWSFMRKKENGYSGGVHVSYNMDRTAPQLMKMIETDDTRNPLVSYLANPDLRPRTKHAFEADFRTNRGRKFFVNARANFSVEQNSSVNGYTYDTRTGATTHKTYNVDGIWRLYTYAQAFWNPNKDWFSSNLTLNYSHNRGYMMVGENSLEPSKFGIDRNTYNPAMELDFFPSDWLTLRLKSDVSWEHSSGGPTATRPASVGGSSVGQTSRAYDFCTQEHSLEADLKLPWKLSANSTLMLYKRSGLDDPRANQTEWIWNARLTRSFLKGRLLASLTAYDLLHQIHSVTYAVSPDSQSQTFTNTIPRYVLLHLQYKLNHKPKRK